MSEQNRNEQDLTGQSAQHEQSQQQETGKKKKKNGKQEEKRTVLQEILSWVGTLLVAVIAALAIRTFIFEPVRVDGESMLDTLRDGEVMFVSKFDFSSSWLSMPWQSDEDKQQAPRFTLGGNPNRFDVVICRYPGRGSLNFVKRVVGLPGDTVAFDNGYLILNGEKQENETYITEAYRSGLNSEMEAFRIPAKGDALVYQNNRLTVAGEPWRWKNGFVTGVSAAGDRLTYNRGEWLLNGKQVTSAEQIEGTEFLLDDDYLFVCGDHRNNSNDSRSVGPIQRSMIVGHVRSVVFPFSAWRGVD